MRQFFAALLVIAGLLGSARAQILERRLAAPGERVVVTAGVPFDVPGTTNLLKIEAI